MRIDFVKKTIGVAIVIMLCGLPVLSVAQDKPADDMQILRDKIKTNKKFLVATNMELTESEAKDSGRFTTSIKRIYRRSIDGWSAFWRATPPIFATSRSPTTKQKN
jgi:hypothetical protein